MKSDHSKQNIQKIKDWIQELNPDGIHFTNETDLIESGILDSMQMVNLVLFIEEVQGKLIPEEKIRPEYFKSIATIEKNIINS